MIRKPPSPPLLRRRELLSALGALPSLALAACGSDEKPKTAASSGESDALSRLLTAVRKSPDHLTSRAADAVASKDATTIARFVRDNITLLPPLDPGSRPEDYSQWGARGTLRAGAGVLRDRAELLAKLLKDAGFDAKVVSMTRPAALDEVALYASKASGFEPDAAVLSALRRQLELPPSGTGLDASAALQVENLADTLLEAVPEAARAATTPATPLPDTLPIVQIDEGASRSWAVALGDIDVLGDEPTGLSGELSLSSPAKVTLTVSVALNPPRGSNVDRSRIYDVLSGSWAAEDVVGRQVLLGFPPPGNPEELLGYDLSSPSARVPTLRLLSPDELDPGIVVSAAGKPLLLAGAVLEVKDDSPSSELVGPFGTVGVADTATRKKLRARVQSITATANAAAFPDIDCALQVKDQDGAPVDGLALEDFVLTEDTAAVSAQLYASNAPRSVKVLAIYDTSGSVAEAWKTPADRAAFESTLADALVSAASSTPFEVQVTALGSPATTDGWQAPDADALRADFAGVSAPFSDVWQSLGSYLPASGASVALFISDAASSLEDATKIDGWKQALSASGIPVAVLPLGAGIDPAAVAEIVALSQGLELDPSSKTLAQDLDDFVAAGAAAALATNYRLRYRAASKGKGERTLHVELASGSSASADATYTVPAEADRATPSGIAGVYVTLEVGGVKTRRRLGGALVSPRDEITSDLTRGVLDEAAAALAGIHTIAFEPGRPTAAHALDDALRAGVTWTTVNAAAKKGVAELLQALPDARPFPLVLPPLFEDAPLDQNDAFLGSGISACIFSVTHGASINLSTDIVPELNLWGGAGTAEARFRAALSRSALLSVRETQVMGKTAAAAQLDGKALFAVVPGSNAVPADWDDDTQARFAPLLSAHDTWIRLVPEDGSVTALWIVDPATGSATAISDADAGGALLQCNTDDGQLAQQLDVALMFLSLGCTLASSQSFVCVGANVYGAAAAAYGSFTHPVTFNTATTAAGAIIGFASGPPGWDPEAVMARALIAVIQVMISLIGIVNDC